jgi:uncharacterized protein
MTTPPLRGRFVWHELHTSQSAAPAGIGFYRKIAGWKTQPYAAVPGYTLLEGPRGPVGGVMAEPEITGPGGMAPSWMSYVGTPDVDSTTAQAQSLGGRVLHAPTDIPVGRFAILADPQGAQFAIYAPNLLEEQDPKPLIGEFSWHELVTTDPVGAFSFYEQLFGWEKTTAVDLGPALGTYQLFGLPGLEMGGIYRKPADYPAPPNWLPYILVPDAARAAAATTAAGGTITMGPQEVPGGDLIAMGMDPQGGSFAVHSAAVTVAAGGTSAARPKKKAAAKKPAKKAAKKPAKKAAKKSAKKTAKRPAAKKAARKPAKKATRKAAPRKKAAKKKVRRR